jgi:hypothetical protein
MEEFKNKNKFNDFDKSSQELLYNYMQQKWIELYENVLAERKNIILEES